jgi:SHS2 domain-containing protein
MPEILEGAGMFEMFDHTADLGLRARADDLPTLFAEAARGLFSMIVEDLATVELRRRIEIELPAGPTEFLFFDWLNRLLAEFEIDRLLLSRFSVILDEHGLHASAEGEPLDPLRHDLSHEVKAITYHGLRVERTGDSWLAEVIVDI